jgi:hypothetical protein
VVPATGNDGAGAAGERVQQRGFADVGAANDGDAGFVLLECAMGSMEAGGLGRWRLRLDRGGVSLGFRERLWFGVGGR